MPLPGAPTAPVLGQPAPVVAPVAPVPRPKLIVQPKPIVGPSRFQAEDAAKPKPAAPANPAARRAAPAPPPPVPAAPEIGTGTGGGMGIAGGAADGKPGGRLGGHGDDVFTLDQVAVKPALIDAPKPRYPAVARARLQEGAVVIEAIVDRAGRVEVASLHVVKSQPPFDDAALEAMRDWKFRPARDDTGAEVRVRIRQSIGFHLRSMEDR